MTMILGKLIVSFKTNHVAQNVCIYSFGITSLDYGSAVDFPTISDQLEGKQE